MYREGIVLYSAFHVQFSYKTPKLVDSNTLTFLQEIFYSYDLVSELLALTE